MLKFLSVGLFAFIFIFLAITTAFAADSAIDLPTFASQVLETVKALGGLSWAAKIASIVMLIVGSMKVEIIRGFIWDKLPASVKPFLPLVLGLLAGILSLNPITLKGVVAYIGAGAGAIIFYELLDAVKVAAAANSTVSGIIGFIQGILKRD